MSDRDLQASRATKLVLTSFFFSTIAAFSTRLRGDPNAPLLKPFDLLLLGLSAYRTGHMISFERVAEPLRAPFTQTIPDGSGAGETVVARGKGVRWALGELFSCPICVGTWAAAGLLYGLHLLPRPTRVYMTIMGATGVAEIIYALTEALVWLGHAQRKLSAPDRPH